MREVFWGMFATPDVASALRASLHNLPLTTRTVFSAVSLLLGT